MIQTKAKVIKNVEVARNYYKIVLSCSEIATASRPGQFVNIKVSDKYEPLLRRPFSIHRVSHEPQSHPSLSLGTGKATKPQRREFLEILYEVVGKGTEILSQRKAGEYLDIIGPLGNGFSILNTQYSILIAGGMGVAPLVFLAEKLTEIPNHKFQIPKILIGAKTKKQILCEKEFKGLGCEVKIATDDGSRGFKGYVSDLLKNLLSTIDYRLSTIYGCGPRSMLKEISNISKKYNIPAQVSLEEHMACGIGACLGCVVKTQYAIRNTQYEYKRICKEGPVFDAREIIWE